MRSLARKYDPRACDLSRTSPMGLTRRYIPLHCASVVFLPSYFDTPGAITVARTSAVEVCITWLSTSRRRRRWFARAVTLRHVSHLGLQPLSHVANGSLAWKCDPRACDLSWTSPMGFMRRYIALHYFGRCSPRYLVTPGAITAARTSSVEVCSTWLSTSRGRRRWIACAVAFCRPSLCHLWCGLSSGSA